MKMNNINLKEYVNALEIKENYCEENKIAIRKRFIYGNLVKIPIGN